MNIIDLIKRMRTAWNAAEPIAEQKPDTFAPGPVQPAALAMAALIEAQRAPRAPQWHALPGLVLELETTGFQIRLNLGCATPKLPSRYTLINPEGWIECFGVDLARIKLHAERQARDRAEFVCDAKGWRP